LNSHVCHANSLCLVQSLACLKVRFIAWAKTTLTGRDVVDDLSGGIPRNLRDQTRNRGNFGLLAALAPRNSSGGARLDIIAISS
jgi:hypothetical protein